jgi:hypothetical protein
MDEDLFANDSAGRVVLCETALLVRDGVVVARVLVTQAGLGLVVALEVSSVFTVLRVPVALWDGLRCFRLDGRRPPPRAGESSATSLVPNLALAEDSLPKAPVPSGDPRRPPRSGARFLMPGFWTVTLSAPQ